MKKNYITPKTESFKIKTGIILGVSGGGDSSAPGNDIGYGGVDEEGTKDPASRKSWNSWDEEEDEDC